MMRRSLAIGVGLLLAGCATVSAVWTSQDFLTAAARAYRVTPPRLVLVDDLILHGGAAYASGVIGVDRDALRSPDLRAILAHEFSHHLLGHTEALCEARECEVEADMQAVDVLGRVSGLSSLAALQWLHAMHRSAMVSCRRSAALLARFPQHRALWQTWECARAATP